MEVQSKNSICQNCGSTLESYFCSNCGQRASIHKVTFKEQAQDLADAVFSVDAPLLMTLKLLLVNPGKLFRDYLDGKRKSFYKPVAFFILTTVVYLLLRSIINYNPMENVNAFQNGSVESKLFIDAGSYMFGNINNFLFFFIFTAGLSLKIFFSKRYSLAEFVAISFYLIGVYTILISLDLFYLKFVNPEMIWISKMMMLIYFLYAIVSFLKKPKGMVLIKALFAYVLAFLFYFISAYSLSLLIVWFKNT